MPHTTGCFWTLHTVSPKYNLLIDIDIDADVDRKLCLNNTRQVFGALRENILIHLQDGFTKTSIDTQLYSQWGTGCWM